MQRVLRYDGLLANLKGGAPFTPEVMSEIREWIGSRRSLQGFDLIAEGSSQSAADVQPWREAGATWWIEADWSTFDPEVVRQRIEAGPPAPL